MGNGNLTRDSLVQESRDRKFRDSGFEDSEGLGHRRYSSTASAIVTSRPLSSYPYQKPPLLGGDVSLVDQQQHQSRLLSQTQFHPPQAQFFSYPPGIELEGSGRVSPRHEPIHEEQLIQRRVTLGDLSTLDPPPKIGDNSTRRSSTSSIPETLVSRIDREKSTVCFQAPIHKQEIYSRDANLDPLISNLVQLHRRDYYTNSRLGGTPQPVQQAPPLQLQMPPPLPVAEPPSGKERSNAPKKDSAVAFNSTYQYPVSGSHPPLVNSGVPQPDLNNRRLSTILPQVQAQAPAPFPAGQRFSTSTNTSNANLLNAAAMASAKQQQEQSQLISPQITPTTGVNGSLGRNRGSPTRQASSTYFNLPPQQHQQQQLKVDTSSAVLSPGLGATASTSAYNHDLSVAMQIQQQQIAQQQQQTQQQIDQIRLQQQMLHQSQQLQQQLDQARAAVAVPSPTERMAGTLPSHQQQPIIGNMPVQFTTTPVLTTTMGYGMGMGMGMNPQSMGVNMVNMGVSTLGGYGQTATPMITQGMVPQLIMSPQMGPQLTQQLTPHLMAFPATSLYTYQQQPQLATMMPTAAAPNGGRTA
ncbi:hypothetical protein BGZ76_005228 [Entomortierella beljakovae]|nr:hypothetical protein BGZ76_005228 [Entomortierella beljakovae]